jgi:hypothetical protein
MNTEANLLNLNEAQGRNPLEFPFGFYMEDDHAQSAGGSFFWYKTEKAMQQSIQNDFINALSDGASDDIAAVKAEIASLIKESGPNAKGDDLVNSLNLFLRAIELRLQFIGSFDNLCKSKNEWVKYFRESYREECLDDIDDISSKKLQRSIKKTEQDDFADFVSDYLI